MPYNILLLPLLAGFLLIARARIFCYPTSQLQKEQLLLWASLAGLSLLLVSRLVCISLVGTPLGTLLLELKDSIAPFPFMGTAVGTLLLAAFLVVVLNTLVSATDAGLWIYHADKFDELESLLYSSAVGVEPTGQRSYPWLLWNQFKLDAIRSRRRWRKPWARNSGAEQAITCFPTGDPRMVMVTMADNKVYVGFASQLPPVVATSFPYLRILPVWSGYRDSDRRVYRTTSYGEALLSPEDHHLLIKVVPTKDIVAAGLYVEGTFPIQDLPKTRKVTKKRVAKKVAPKKGLATKRLRLRSKASARLT